MAEFNKKIGFQYDLKQFEKNVNRFIDETLEQTEDIVKDMAPIFSTTAAKYTPPNIGKATIDKKYYTRPIFNLIDLAKGKYENQRCTAQDYKQLRAGMKFKVLNTKKGVKKGVAFAYCKKISQAKKLAKIKNRGLSRVMWGKDMQSIDRPVPASIQRLQHKSPEMTNKQLNIISQQKNKDEVSVEITNKVSQIQAYAKLAQRQGEKKVMKQINSRLKQIADKKVQV